MVFGIPGRPWEIAHPQMVVRNGSGRSSKPPSQFLLSAPGLGAVHDRTGEPAAVTKDGQKFSLHKGNDSLDLPKELLTDLVQNGEVSSITFASAFF
jgi:hypothetical protein